MKSLKELTIAGLTALVIGCGPNLSSPENTVESYFNAIERGNKSAVLQCLVETCTGRGIMGQPIPMEKKITDRFMKYLKNNYEENFKGYKGRASEDMIVKRESDDFVAFWAKGGDALIYVIKENNKWKITEIGSNRDYILNCSG